jgi:hypothetical protein
VHPMPMDPMPVDTSGVGGSAKHQVKGGSERVLDVE